MTSLISIHDDFTWWFVDFIHIETDSSSGVEDDEALSFEEETFKITRASYFSGAYGNSLSNQSELYSTSNEITQTNGVIEERQTVNALNVVDEVNTNQSIALFQPPLNTNITQDPEVWALANNIGKIASGWWYNIYSN